MANPKLVFTFQKNKEKGEQFKLEGENQKDNIKNNVNGISSELINRTTGYPRKLAKEEETSKPPSLNNNADLEDSKNQISALKETQQPLSDTNKPTTDKESKTKTAVPFALFADNDSLKSETKPLSSDINTDIDDSDDKTDTALKGSETKLLSSSTKGGESIGSGKKSALNESETEPLSSSRVGGESNGSGKESALKESETKLLSPDTGNRESTGSDQITDLKGPETTPLSLDSNKDVPDLDKKTYTALEENGIETTTDSGEKNTCLQKHDETNTQQQNNISVQVNGPIKPTFNKKAISFDDSNIDLDQSGIHEMIQLSNLDEENKDTEVKYSATETANDIIPIYDLNNKSDAGVTQLSSSDPELGLDNPAFFETIDLNSVEKSSTDADDIEDHNKTKEHKKVHRTGIRFSIHDSLDSPKKSRFNRKLGNVVIVVCASCNLYFSLGLVFSLGTFLPSWLEDFQESRATTASIQSFLIGIVFGAGILSGFLIDRFGVRFSLKAGSILSACGFLGGVFCPNTTSLMIVLGLLTGIGGSLVQLGSMVAISIKLKHSATFAIGMITTGGGIGSATMPLIMRSLINAYGWRGAFYILAGFELQMLVFSSLMVVFMDGKASKKKTQTMGWKKKLSTVCKPSYISVTVAIFGGLGTMNGFLFIILDWAYLRNGDGVFYLFFISLCSASIRLIVGALSMLRFVSASVILCVAVLSGGITLICLGLDSTSTTTIFTLVIFGICYGGLIGIFAGAVLEQVGQEAFSLALGITSTLNGVANLSCGILYGLMFDITKSYTFPLHTFGPIAVVCGMVLLIVITKERICRSRFINRVE